MSTTYETGSTLGVLARQEIRNYLGTSCSGSAPR